MRVLVAMSGGVDSSVAAARAVDAGHEVVGVHLALSRMPGTLRTGLPATFVLWEPWDLTVRSLAERVDTWSTDPRSRTPLLPDLDQGSPRAVRTVVDGRVVHDDLGGDGE